VRAGETINIPANAPHSFRNASQGSVRLLLHLRTSRTGGVLRRGRHCGGVPDNPCTQAR
jgi:hypothetical protein